MSLDLYINGSLPVTLHINLKASFAWLIPRLPHNYIRKYNDFLSIANLHPNFNNKSSFPLSRISNPKSSCSLPFVIAFQLTSWLFHYLPFVSCLASSLNQQGGMDALFDGFLLSYKIMILSFWRKKKVAVPSLSHRTLLWVPHT